MHNFAKSYKQTIALLAVDNISLRKTGLNLYVAVDRGEITVTDVKSIQTQSTSVGVVWAEFNAM